MKAFIAKSSTIIRSVSTFFFKTFCQNFLIIWGPFSTKPKFCEKWLKKISPRSQNRAMILPKTFSFFPIFMLECLGTSPPPNESFHRKIVDDYPVRLDIFFFKLFVKIFWSFEDLFRQNPNFVKNDSKKISPRSQNRAMILPKTSSFFPIFMLECLGMSPPPNESFHRKIVDDYPVRLDIFFLNFLSKFFDHLRTFFDKTQILWKMTQKKYHRGVKIERWFCQRPLHSSQFLCWSV